jgi:hypothetical protein
MRRGEAAYMQKHFMKWAVICGVAFGFCLGLAQAQDEHALSPVTSGSSVTLDAFAKRIDDKARGYQARYPGAMIDRTIDYDIAFPKDAAEFQSLSGYAVMLVSASVHDQSELPLAKVYLALNGKVAELPVIARARRTVPSGSNANTEFGPYREDAFVVVPAVVLFTQASFLADFAAHRNAFEFAKGPVNAPGYLAADKSLLTAQIKPSPSVDVFKALSQWDFPGFLEN